MRRTLIIATLALAVLAAWLGGRSLLRPTRIAVVNPLPSQAADLALNNDTRLVSVTTISKDDLTDLSAFDAVMIYSRGLFLDSLQMQVLEDAKARGIPIFSNDTRSGAFSFCANITDGQQDTLSTYFKNATRQNYRNVLRYIRHLAQPRALISIGWEPPVELPTRMFYHTDYGRYFSTPEELTAHLRERGIYNEGGQTIGLIAGHTLPMEGNRDHVDQLIDSLTHAGFNVYPFTAQPEARDSMLHALHPDALVYLPLGRLGDEGTAQWLHEMNIPLFTPFTLVESRDAWLDASRPLSGGTVTVRIVIPEVDGAIAPFCLATQNENAEGFVRNTAEPERIGAFTERLRRQMLLRTMPNKDKRVCIFFFKHPGQDALLASGLEVIPSLYNVLRRMQSEGYDVGHLPPTLEAFSRLVRAEGQVLGTYARGAQERYMNEGHPTWVARADYERWAKQTLRPEKYAEVVNHYGAAPGQLLVRGDSIAVAGIRFGNVMLLPQPRPALGEDEHRLVHNCQVPPPHSYIAPYLFAQHAFRADVLVHFGTHGTLEFTPGKNMALSDADWSDRLVGSLPHVYLYTTANIGESVIAKRRTSATLITYLTPPFVDNGLTTYDDEIAHEPVLGAYYTLGEPYDEADLSTTARAIAADGLCTESEARQLLVHSTAAEMDALMRALSGGTVAPAPGGDPVRSPNVLPTGRNMHSVNAELTPTEEAWEQGKALAEATLEDYKARHGCLPQKVSYTLWAGEFIQTEGATIAQALWMMGVEPVRDSQGRIADLRLVPREELGRERIDVMVQTSGQLRDIAGSRLMMITQAVRMASADEAPDNHVRQGTLMQERALVDRGTTPRRAREMATMRVFGPLNNGYSTALMELTERSGEWDEEGVLAQAYLNNMAAAYGDEASWAEVDDGLLQAALVGTDVVVQPRQSNTWGPVSLDHVYEFAGALSLAAKSINGHEPDALMADYRNASRPRLQSLERAIEVETRASLLNPHWIRARMKGGEGTAEMFGKLFRNIFGWKATRPSVLDAGLMDNLYDTYVADAEGLGLREYFAQTNPAALQTITAVMAESARKGYWQASDEQLLTVARLHAELTEEAGAACTQFVCGNDKLTAFIASQLPEAQAQAYNTTMTQTLSGSAADQRAIVMENTATTPTDEGHAWHIARPWLVGAVALLFLALVALLALRRRQ